ncbi:MAG: 30S ribosome-binding factor RbfA [Planctomycetes bacterium]|nr:30S ribosome-binding factor RbfA [Planctomycetota bacterium]
MSRKTQRVGSLIRQVLGEVILAKLSDPRIDPARTSIVRVEVPEDLLTAKVFVSVMGTEAQQRRTIRALRHAGGRLQELMMQRITLRHTPVLDFQIDVRFKKTLQTLDLIEQAMAEIRRKEQAEADQDRPQRDQADQDPPGRAAAGEAPRTS